MTSFDRGLGSGLVDTAGSFAIGDGHADEAGFSPGGAPGVLNRDVIYTIFSSKSNCKHTVVKLDATLGAGDDAALVVAKDWLVSLNSNRYGAILEVLNELIGVVNRHIREASHLGDTLGWIGPAVEDECFLVRVISLGLKRCVLQVGESAVHKATTA